MGTKNCKKKTHLSHCHAAGKHSLTERKTFKSLGKTLLIVFAGGNHSGTMRNKKVCCLPVIDINHDRAKFIC